MEKTLNVRYYVDYETGRAHLCRHGVSEQEAEEVLVRPGEDRAGHEGARVAIGRTCAGRYLRVIYIPDPEPKGVFVITAYELKGRPLTAYKRRIRWRR